MIESDLVTTNRCRFCDAELSETFADLGMSPLSNSFLRAERLQQMEPFYPLHAYVCGACFLVQLREFESPQNIFSDYAYFSSYSDSWLRHAQAYAEAMVRRLGLTRDSRVVEIASNDGYLLQYFKAKGVQVLGVEPAANVAAMALQKGIPTEVRFFGTDTASALRAGGKAADLIAANNVLAHVPDINDFVAGFKVLLKPGGCITVEFPHLLRLMAENQFDTIYHEHFSYLSFMVVEKIFGRHGLKIFDVEELPTHGGSLRVFAAHADDAGRRPEPRVGELRQRELQAGLSSIAAYRGFAGDVVRTKCEVMEFFVQAKRAGRKVIGYGAPAKGNTLLNYCGIGRELMEFTVDRSPHKQGLHLPGTHIPIRPPEALLAATPDYVFILPWNLKDEIMEQMAEVRSWGARFVVPIPRIQEF
ncbi:MAG: class I SAM-dependent methyltransferase [Betaproteobacteria bacterium]|nr:class I SAM-dependent methyltransferase [Betaproteobacteria bacterium]